MADTNAVFQLPDDNWDRLINHDDLHAHLRRLVSAGTPLPDSEHLLSDPVEAPIGTQEVWAAGVTYLRSREARIEEAEKAGGGDFYSRVYDAERPELFFKATPHRTVGSGGKVRIRRDSTWNVPEPELALFINAKGRIAGYTIGNDMSSRSIEGENPLYLPQAKVYDGCAGLGPCLYVPPQPIEPHTIIHMHILRAGQMMYDDSVPISRMKRGHQELVDFLYRESSFPNGCYLMTGTCLVPPSEFTLQSGDEIRITIGPIGTLVNVVA